MIPSPRPQAAMWELQERRFRGPLRELRRRGLVVIDDPRRLVGIVVAIEM